MSIISKLSIIFFGNTKYSNIGLKIVHSIYPISLIVTKHIPQNPVKQLGDKLQIPTVETNKLDEKTLKVIIGLNPDFFIVEDYGLILPLRFLSVPKFAPLNIHHSLLPKYRGPSPAPYTILNGDKTSGVSVIKMVDEVDAGDVLSQREYELTKEETTDSLLTKLNILGGNLVISVIKQYLEGSAAALKQNNSQASYTKHFTREDGYFDINNPPSLQTLDRMTRAYYPWPGVWTKWRVKSLESRVKEKVVKFLPGGLIQMEGKKAISYKDFLNGYPDFPLKVLT